MNSGNPSKHRDAINQFLAGIIILDFDMKAALHFGDILAELKQKKRTENNKDRDKMIAAHARSCGFTLVTNNTKDFINIDGLVLEDWREPGDLVWK